MPGVHEPLTDALLDPATYAGDLHGALGALRRDAPLAWNGTKGFWAVARHAEPLLNEGGSMVTLTYYASEKVVPKYNVMGIAKSALEASVRYLAYEMGRKQVRVNAISAGPVRTVAARSIPGFMKMFNKVAGIAPLGRNVTHEEVGNLGLFLLSPLSSGITGETIYVDAGYHIMGMELGEESS